MFNNFLVWKCRGAGSPKTMNYLIDIIKHKLGLVALLETRVHSSKMDDILKRSKLKSFVAVEACDFVGDI